jgi:IMP dehydrogenase
LGKGIKLDIPIVSANMKNVTGFEMAKCIAELGGLAILHRFFDDPVEDQIKIFNQLVAIDSSFANHVGVSIGVKDSDYRSIEQFVKAGVKIVCVDIAHANSKLAIDIVEYIHDTFPGILLIAGNIATKEGAINLAKAGADVIKCGIGGGSVCTTRTESGNGVPQLTALSDVYDVIIEFPHIKLIADGGMKITADIIKALCFSDCVMLGNLLAGSEQAPGEVITVNGQRYKQYAGSSTFQPKHVEGVIGLVSLKGSATNIIIKLLEGIRSGLSYQGANNLIDLKKDPQFVSLSGSGLIESHPHDVKLF